MTVTDTPVNLFDMLDGITEALPEKDLLSLSGNIRLIAGQTSTFPVEDRTGYINVPELRILRLQAFTNSNGMVVLRTEFAMKGEQIGLLDGEGNQVPLPLYTHVAFGTWASWIHRVHSECMRPIDDNIEELHNACLTAGYVPWTPRATSREYERTSETIFDIEPVGDQITDKYNNALSVVSATLIPDDRDGMLQTSYENKEGDVIERSGFTGFFDVLVPAMIRANQAAASLAATDTKDRAAMKDARETARTEMQRLAILSGYDPTEGEGWPLRPTLGYITLSTDDPDQPNELRILGMPNTDATPVATTTQVADVPDPLAADNFVDE